MKVVIADTGVIISLIHINQLYLIDKLFDKLFIAEAVWNELNSYNHPRFDKIQLSSIKNCVLRTKNKKLLNAFIDEGEIESILLYQEKQADLLIIDDNKARLFAESMGINCIGTLGLLIKAKQNGWIKNLQEIFLELLNNGRYYSKDLLNEILISLEEQPLKN